MKKKLKPNVIAMYLPQYHEIPENSKFWGKGYTDWVAVKKAEPLFENHSQPRVPLNNEYYDLSKKENVKWQAELALSYGVDGFGIYHYWFSSNKCLLTKPAEIIRDNVDINIKYMFCWDNASWRRTWSNVRIGNDWAPLYDNAEADSERKGILAELDYGKENDWKIHFEYLLTFFKDERYIKIDNSPVFCIFNQDNGADIIQKMCVYWNQLARKAGFAGIYYIGKKNNNNISVTDCEFVYEPEWTGWTWHNQLERIRNKIYNIYTKKKSGMLIYDYDIIWKRIIKSAESNKDRSLYYSCFTGYDDTPRRGVHGKLVLNGTPEKFNIYIRKLLDICDRQGKDFLFVIAWNEWGEGAYLEPDQKDRLGYLEALKKARDELEGTE